METGPEVQMYTKAWCPYCAAARAMLGKKRVRLTEIDIGQFPERAAEMIARSGRYSVPQIFIGTTHVGGFDDLAAMERAATLDALLQSSH